MPFLLIMNIKCIKFGVASTGRQTEKNIGYSSIIEANNNIYDQIKKDIPSFILTRGTESYPCPH